MPSAAIRWRSKRMPKGADLHSHLHSAVYAETLIRDAIEDKLCVDTAAYSFAKADSIRDDMPVCKEGTLPAATAYQDQALYNKLIDAEAKRGALGQCGEPEEAAGCKVALRYIYEVFRNTPKELVFAQALFGFELAAADPRVVSINFVGQEDAHDAMTDYAEHMRMVGFLRTLYPDVRVSLHAGELALGLVPPEALCCHIRLAVEEARTDRIGHGVDVMYEDNPHELLKNMADKGVLVEINLTSNDMILGVKGKHHPFQTYRKFGVPVALSTDDAGIERIDLTHEYVRAVESYELSYADLKEIVRNSLEYSFLPGASLWDEKAGYARAASACRSDVPGTVTPSPVCADFLGKSEKATQQWELERRFQTFEASFSNDPLCLALQEPGHSSRDQCGE
ncbi:MAG TPA: hypothetical protein VFR71_09160 [Methyloceanibacter sp.]|nr:hypothetical protein [Methyloceanibacter sp.]